MHAQHGFHVVVHAHVKHLLCAREVRQEGLYGVAFGAEAGVRERVFDGQEVAHVLQTVGRGEGCAVAAATAATAAALAGRGCVLGNGRPVLFEAQLGGFGRGSWVEVGCGFGVPTWPAGASSFLGF